MDQLREITAEIKRENCVLIVGPDIADFGEKSFFETMCDELMSANNTTNIFEAAPQYIFANEELFQLMTPRNESSLELLMIDFYARQTALDDPLTKISQIPFHLVISLMPDDRLCKIFKRQNIEYNYGHYPREGPVANVPKPTREKPLVYNLLGDFNELGPIITFDHLFAFLSGIMGKRELPQTIQESLKKARTFVFLGVHFEKWYVQLLLRIITSKEDRKNKYTILKNGINNDACTFIARRLELDFVNTDPHEYLTALFDECRTQDILRTISARFKARCFISYSSRDKAVAERVETLLRSNDIDAVRDDAVAHPGQKIENFISTISAMDFVFLIVSKDSLQSPWVSKEIVTAVEFGKQLIPCYLDKAFLADEFWMQLQELIVMRSNEIGQKIADRGTDSIDDLLGERRDWTDLKRNIPQVREVLSRSICKPILPDEFEITMRQIIQFITKPK